MHPLTGLPATKEQPMGAQPAADAGKKEEEKVDFVVVASPEPEEKL